MRNVATIGGHLAHGDPHMDLPPVLIALGAQVAVSGPSGERKIAVEELFAGYFETVLASNELITELHVPAQGKARAAYLKVTTRSAHDWPALGVAVALEADGTTVNPRASWSAPRPSRPMRLAAAEAVARRRDASTTAARARRRCGRRGSASASSDAHGCAAYKRELVRVYVGRALRKRLTNKRATAERPTDGNDMIQAVKSAQVGRSIPRLEARAKVTGRAEYIHNMRLPGMLHGKIFRSTVAHGRIKSIDTSAAQACRASTASSPPTTCARSSRTPITARPSTISRSWRSTRCIMSASRSPSCWPPIPHVAEEAAQLIDAEYEELPAVYDEVEALTSQAIVHDVLKPAGTFPDLKHLKGRRTPMSRSTSSCGAATSTRRFAEADHVFEHTFRTQKVMHPRSSRSCRWPTGRRRGAHHLQRRAEPVVRAHRDRAPARLAGEPRAREGAVSRRRLRREALHQAGGAGGRALPARRAAR